MMMRHEATSPARRDIILRGGGKLQETGKNKRGESQRCNTTKRAGSLLLSACRVSMLVVSCGIFSKKKVRRKS
jgi:hypothetical protein